MRGNLTVKPVENRENVSWVKFQAVTRSRIGMKAVTLLLLVVPYLICNIFTQGSFLTGSNILSVLTHAVVPSFVAWGFCFIFTTGIIDLSVGAIIILSSIAGGLLAIDYGYPGLILGAVAVAAALEMVNLNALLKMKIPSWVFGLGMAMVYEAIGTYYGSSQLRMGRQVVSLGNTARQLGTPPWNIAALALGLAAGYIIFNRTSIGFNIRAVGSNALVSKMMGVNTNRAIILGGLVGSLFIGMASAINESYAGRVMPVTGLNSVSMIFIPLAVYLLAQAFQRVFDLMFSVVISAVIIQSLFNILTIFGVPSGTWQDVTLGAVVIVCGILSQRNYKGVVK